MIELDELIIFWDIIGLNYFDEVTDFGIVIEQDQRMPRNF